MYLKEVTINFNLLFFNNENKQSEQLDTYCVCAFLSDLAELYRNVPEMMHSLNICIYRHWI